MRKQLIHHSLKVTLQKKLLNLRLPPTLNSGDQLAAELIEEKKALDRARYIHWHTLTII